MDTLTRSEFLAKDEVKQVLGELKNAARRALPTGSFAEREADPGQPPARTYALRLHARVACAPACPA